jgi:mRNA deadenylase 3'-5' endonuclease subunit Ccr4
MSTAQSDGRPSIRVTSYNILADAYATKRLYPTVPPALLDWSRRCRSIVARIDELNPEVACLQEVQATRWADLHSSLMPLGWDGIFRQKGMSRVDGCALVYRTAAVSLLHSEAVYFSDGAEPSGHLALMGVLATPIGPVRIVTTHLRWQSDTSEARSHIGYRQATELLTRLAAEQTPATVVCGDFNISPGHPVVQLFADHGFRDASGASPQSTCAPNGRAARIDYIFASRDLSAAAERLPALTDATVMPNGDEPSDHLPITARIELGAAEI